MVGKRQYSAAIPKAQASVAHYGVNQVRARENDNARYSQTQDYRTRLEEVR
jgi:hypothetical protein